MSDDIVDGAMIDTGIRYCIVHEGVIDVDQADCDFADHGDPDGECLSRPLFYFTDAADPKGGGGE